MNARDYDPLATDVSHDRQVLEQFRRPAGPSQSHDVVGVCDIRHPHKPWMIRKVHVGPACINANGSPIAGYVLLDLAKRFPQRRPPNIDIILADKAAALTFGWR